MSPDRQTRNYCVHGTQFRILCSPPMAAYLDQRFRMFPAEGEYTETVYLDFQSVGDPDQHVIKKPQSEGLPFYEMPKGVAIYYRETDEIYISFGEGVRALCKPSSDCALFSVVESEPKNLLVASHLVLTILFVEIFKRRDWYGLHAAGFSENGNAILIPGTSGTGKSTLSVALLRAKFDFISDDMVFLRRRTDGLVVWGLVEDVRLSDRTIRFFPELDFLLGSAKTDGYPKRRVRADEIYGTKVVTEAHPRVIVLPRISGKMSSFITQIESDEALHEIVYNVLLTEARSCQGHLAVLAELVKHTACYRLETGQDFNRIPTLLRALLSCGEEKVCA